MLRIGITIPRIRTLGIVDGRVTILTIDANSTGWTAFCFLPYLSLIDPIWLDQQVTHFAKMGANVFIVPSGPRPLHRLWLEEPRKTRTPLLHDPLGKLHRLFGIHGRLTPVRCHTAICDPDGVLRAAVVHDFSEPSLSTLRHNTLAPWIQNMPPDGVELARTNIDPPSIVQLAESVSVARQP